MVHDDADSDEHYCRLLGAFGLLVQFVLAVSIFSCLFLKWLLERDPVVYRKLCCTDNDPVERTFSVFVLDVSKQVVAAAVVHVINIAQAFLLRGINSREHCNQCVWYLIGVVGDCFISTFICCIILKKLRPFLSKHFNVDIGAYEKQSSNNDLVDPNSISFCAWLQQTIIWITIILQVRAFILLFVYFYREILYSFVASFVTPMDSKTQLVLALVIVPLIGNNMQFWIQDSYLKSKYSRASVSSLQGSGFEPLNLKGDNFSSDNDPDIELVKCSRDDSSTRISASEWETK
eukprot:GEMP01020049.1.p1 GENE.GEMP01020049.1~~GEMP01020049.1.p1  ORF type:complete len:290 (+),score=31.93 GEMP01020049.1:85-954(+)